MSWKQMGERWGSNNH